MAQVETTIWNCNSQKCRDAEKKDGKHQIIVETTKDGNIEVYCYLCGGKIFS